MLADKLVVLHLKKAMGYNSGRFALYHNGAHHGKRIQKNDFQIGGAVQEALAYSAIRMPTWQAVCRSFDCCQRIDFEKKEKMSVHCLSSKLMRRLRSTASSMKRCLTF